MCAIISNLILIGQGLFYLMLLIFSHDSHTSSKFPNLEPRHLVSSLGFVRLLPAPMVIGVSASITLALIHSRKRVGLILRSSANTGKQEGGY